MKVKVIVNPSSGRQNFKMKLDRLIYLLHSNKYQVSLSYTEKQNDARDFASKACQEDFDLIIAIGGDGTINEVVQGMVRLDSDIPLAIFSAGTVNDFASYLELPKNMDEFFQMIEDGKTIYVDVGKINEDYFINVAACGLFTEIAYEVEDDLKARWGRMAYYIEGGRKIIEQISEPTEPFQLTLKTREESYQMEALLFLITNTKSIGGFRNLAPRAHISDGKFDVLVIKSLDFLELGPLVMNSIVGGHIRHKSVVYFKTDYLEIDADVSLTIDIDGERGDDLPAKFEVLHKALRIYVPQRWKYESS